ncbi:MAG: hypothetical protein GY790_11870 [Bacteroidetes bacterium]|nr:hypothetical protein [Bacteroidota bacterium]
MDHSIDEIRLLSVLERIRQVKSATDNSPHSFVALKTNNIRRSYNRKIPELREHIPRSSSSGKRTLDEFRQRYRGFKAKRLLI